MSNTGQVLSYSQKKGNAWQFINMEAHFCQFDGIKKKKKILLVNTMTDNRAKITTLILIKTITLNLKKKKRLVIENNDLLSHNNEMST